ncbi:MAG TPA: general stress protein [Azospirillaceae bacterium]|nr:general stress protein [Azospirillaceae bacterium]
MIGSGHTLVALYDAFEDAERAVMALDAAGIPRDDVSVVTNQEEQLRQSALGTVPYASSVGRTVQPVVGVNPVVSGGPMASALGGTGSVAGALSFLGVPTGEAKEYEDMVLEGGTLITARLGDAGDAERLAAMLRG